jgi:hypothetical protein
MASVASAVRTAIVNANITGVTTKVYRDQAPDSTTYPFVTLDDDVSREPVLEGDAAVTVRRKVMWINLWQVTSAEDVDLIEDLLAAVDGATLTGADKTILKCKVQDVSRATDPSEQVCRSWLTVNITHSN